MKKEAERLRPKEHDPTLMFDATSNQGLDEVTCSGPIKPRLFYVFQLVYWRKELEDGKACSGKQEIHNNM